MRMKKNKGVSDKLNVFNKTEFNGFILSQKDTVHLQILLEAKTKANKYGDERRAWVKISRKFDPTAGDSKTRLRTKFDKC